MQTDSECNLKDYSYIYTCIYINLERKRFPRYLLYPIIHFTSTKTFTILDNQKIDYLDIDITKDCATQ